MKHGEKIKEQIIEKGLELWNEDATLFSARNIAKHLGMSHPGVLYHFENFDNLKNAVAVRAVELKNSNIIVQLCFSKHPAIQDLTDEQRAEHLLIVCD